MISDRDRDILRASALQAQFNQRMPGMILELLEENAGLREALQRIVDSTPVEARGVDYEIALIALKGGAQ